jgi:hypothetical protein
MKGNESIRGRPMKKKKTAQREDKARKQTLQGRERTKY